MEETRIILTHECEECETKMEKSYLLLDGELPVVFIGQTSFTCPECGMGHHLGDIEFLTDDEI